MVFETMLSEYESMEAEYFSQKAELISNDRKLVFSDGKVDSNLCDATYFQNANRTYYIARIVL